VGSQSLYRRGGEEKFPSPFRDSNPDHPGRSYSNELSQLLSFLLKNF
jgi:hypothetical protein